LSRPATREARQRGVRFEEVDLPGLRTIDGIAEADGNYPSTGASGERAAWFRDSEGNLLGIGPASTPMTCEAHPHRSRAAIGGGFDEVGRDLASDAVVEVPPCQGCRAAPGWDDGSQG
jgi:hypothetical protein